MIRKKVLVSNVISYCSKCLQKTEHNILFSKKNGSKNGDDFGWSEEFQVLECAGCKNISFRKEYQDEDMIASGPEAKGEYYSDISIFPPCLRGHKELDNGHLLPYKIGLVYNDTIKAFKANSNLLAAVGFRAVIEAICIEEEINGKNLEDKIKKLGTNKLITEKEEKRLHSIRFLGNDSVHEMAKPSNDQLYIVLEIIDHLLNNLYLIDHNSVGQLDTVIDNYQDFASLLHTKAKKIGAGEERTLKELLGKDLRRVMDHLIQLEQELINAIKSGSMTFLSMGKVIESDGKTSSTQYYVIR